MAKILLKNIGCLYSGNIKEPVLKANSILIEDGKIVEVGNDLSAADAKVIDAKGTTVMPGLIGAHHLAQFGRQFRQGIVAHGTRR